MVAVKFTLALVDGRPVVIEEQPGLPVLVHTFDRAEDALEFYEGHRPEPLDPINRQRVIQAGKAGLQ